MMVKNWTQRAREDESAQSVRGADLPIPSRSEVLHPIRLVIGQIRRDVAVAGVAEDTANEAALGCLPRHRPLSVDVVDGKVNGLAADHAVVLFTNTTLPVGENVVKVVVIGE